MRADVGAICGLGRALRFLAEADVVTRFAGVLFVVEPGAVFWAAVELAGVDLAVCAEAAAGAMKSTSAQESSAAEM